MAKHERSAKVFFRDTFAGTLSEKEDEYIFEYDAKYIESSSHPISFTLPVERKRFVSRNLFPFFDGLIPEGWLLQIAIQNFKIKPLDRMGLLLALGRDPIGAVSIENQETTNKRPKINKVEASEVRDEERCLKCYQDLEPKSGAYHSKCAKQIFGSVTPPLLEIDDSALEELAARSIIAGHGLTGVQKKLLLSLDRQSGQPARLTLKGLLPDFILKPQGDEFEFLPEVEDLTMKLAALSKIITAEHTLIRLKNGSLAYLTKRFDRMNGQKLALEDMAQLTEVPTEHKYKSSIEKVAKVTRTYSSAKGNEIFRFVQLVLFSYVTGNSDMHLKNYSLLTLEDESTALSPAYDLINTRLFISEKENSEESALAINGKKAKLKREDFVRAGIAIGLNEKIITTLIKNLGADFASWKIKINESFLPKDLRVKYLALVERRLKILAG